MGMLMLQRAQTPPWSSWEYWGLHVAALLIVLAVLFTLHIFLKRGGGIGIWSAVVGKDKRVSTSKLQVALWTVFVPAALLSIVLHAWRNLSELGEEISVPSDYLFLLGFPVATAIAAKTITSVKVAAGTVPKVDAPSDTNLERGVVEAVGDDEGNVEIFDLQYVLFNVVALLFFLITFLSQHDDPDGLLDFPELPAGLLILTGASAAGYLGRKTLETERPVLSGVYPQAAVPGEEVWLRGVNLTIRSEPTGNKPQSAPVSIQGITFGGLPAGAGEPIPGADDGFKVRVPWEAKPGPTKVRVVRGDGVESDELDFTVLESRPEIRSVYPTKILPAQPSDGSGGNADEKITILGVRFGEGGSNGKAPEGAAVLLGGRPLDVYAWRPDRIEAHAPTEEEAKHADLARSTALDLEVVDARGAKSEPRTVELLPAREADPK
jgi:hypothetical protein